MIVQGNCEICKARIEKAATSINGVSFTNRNILDGKLSLTFDPRRTDLNEINLDITRSILEVIPEEEGSTIVFTECEFKSHQILETYGKVKGLIKKAI